MAGARVGDEVERVDERGAVSAGDGCAQALSHRVAEALVGEVALAQPVRDAAQRVEVGQPDGPAGAGEQAHELGAGRWVVDDAEGRDEVGDLGLAEQPADAEHVEGNAPTAQGVEEDRLGCPAAHQERRRRRGLARPAAVVVVARSHPCGAPVEPEPLGEPGSDEFGLLLDGLALAGLDRMLACVRRRSERADRHPATRRQRFDERVRDVEDAGAVAPRRAERVAVDGGRAVGGETRGEVVEVRGARAAPAVDRLVRVADGHDGGAGEEGGE